VIRSKTKTELRKIAQRALESEYGFAPALNAITLLEANGEGTYILFSVNGKEYRFNSDIRHGDVWVGSGTIEKTGYDYSKEEYKEC
jgi:hypothetical protein